MMNLEEKDSPKKEQYSVLNRTITIDYARDSKLTDFGKATLKDRYLWEGENFQKMFARVAAAYSDDDAHAQRLYDAISNLWFMPSTPILSNAGHSKTLPISCFLNSVEDSLEGIFSTLNENNWLAARGGGIGTYWGQVRSIGEPVSIKGETSGIIPFIKMMDSATIGVSQGGLRRGSAAVYLDVSHPEIEEFIEVRNPIGGDPHRRSLNIHNAVVISDAFMEAVRDGRDWHLVSPFSQKVMSVVDARTLWQKILTRRLEVGEPYIWFADTVNRSAPASYKINGLTNKQSNLCSEITLHTGRDYNNKDRTAVCCLSSMNLETYDEWAGNAELIEDVLRMLDNVMTSFIKMTDGVQGFEKARYGALMERSVGLGVMGFHSFLQGRKIPFEGVMAKVWNNKIFSWLNETAKKVNLKLSIERGPNPDALRAGLQERFSHIFSIAPTASISIIAGESSPGIEPYLANGYKQKTLSGWFIVKNKHLDKLLTGKWHEMFGNGGPDYKTWMNEQWQIITQNKGSVASLPYLTQDEKDIFKTAFEIDQNWILEHAADRQSKICQGQSLNIFIPADIDKKSFNALHFKAWKLGIKGLYYCRSRSIQQVMNISHVAGEMPEANDVIDTKDMEFNDANECLSCQ